MSAHNFNWKVVFKIEHHPHGEIVVSAPTEAAARAHVAAIHPYDLTLHAPGIDARDAISLHANKVAAPNVPDSPITPGRPFKFLEILSVTRLVPEYLAALKAEIARHEG